MASLKRLVRCWVADSVHNADNFETLLQGMFGNDTRMFGSPGSQFAGAKYGVVTSSISDATPFLLANYNGQNSRQHTTPPQAEGSHSAYELLRPEEPREEPRLWEAYVCSEYWGISC
jgi:hypothetical protein